MGDDRQPTIGVLLAGVILAFWLGSLVVLAPIDLGQLSPPGVLLGIWLRTFLHTGLFIIGHDAMHGTLWPRQPAWNHRLGSFALRLYALLPYQQCRAKHGQHHQHPGQGGDPDWHDGVHAHILAWYMKFMGTYLDTRQKGILLLGMGLAFSILHLGLQIPAVNLLLFWVLPIFLSSLQLFFFGTYLPHRAGPNQHADRHHAVSSRYPVILSFLACYHFGYHWEHHEHPHRPWYQLPALRRPQAL